MEESRAAQATREARGIDWNPRLVNASWSSLRSCLGEWSRGWAHPLLLL